MTFFRLLEDLRQLHRLRGGQRREFESTCCWHHATILIIDEVRELRMFEADAAALDELLNQRYVAKLFTIFVTHDREAEFWGVLGGRVRSRFSELGEIVRFNLPDFRATKAALARGTDR